MMSTAIEFNNISKQYRLGLVSTRTLSHDLNRWWTVNVLRKEDPYLKIGETNDRSSKGNSEYVWALKDINFKVEQGDVVGIIGKNGAGKSTLLKLLSKVTGPTTGTIKARGRIGSLLEVGTGFHPEMTGRENIFMNGAILGMNKKEIQSKLDEIVDFSGCERYIDTPVKRYSSGMMVRLGFAVAAHLDPEILVVDEVLAVGDAEFQKKAIGKMQDVSKGEGRTVLFVSHNMASVKALCQNGILLENGSVKYTGNIKDTVDYYIGDGGSTENQFFDDLSSAPGNDTIRIKSFEILPLLRESAIIDIETGIKFKFQFMCYKKDAMLDVNIEIKTLDDIIVFQIGKVLGYVGSKDSKIGLYDVELNINPYILNAGKYKAEVFFGENQRYCIFEGFGQNFNVENTLSDMGFNQNVMPGILRLSNNDLKITYLGN
ncbi:MAG: ABC transporter ATP-binding protein [Bacteroidales bacterium]|nr:ABC transporter ATP-binding protein [Bacteroidales bacterium]MDY6427789.1 ABC transporter ATP-binding protein [Bacteroidales bacterium]